MTNVQRHVDIEVFRVLKGDSFVEIPRQPFLDKYGAHAFIRFRTDEFHNIKGMKEITHFNLQHSGHIVGEKYIVIRIAKHGYFDGEHEELPVLDIDEAFLVECTLSKNNIPYEELSEEDFKNSPDHIQNVEELKQIILKRYGQSMPNLNKEEILKLGIARTDLRVLHPLNHS